jgi:hypothetical protein
LRIVGLRIEEEGRYRGELAGKIPIRTPRDRPGADLDLKLDVEGDLLFLLAQMARIDLSASGQGVLTCRLVGTLDNLEVASGELTVDRGVVRGWHVTGDIGDIKARVVVEPGTRFLKIEELAARVRGGKLSVSNLESLEIEGEPVPPLIIEPVGLGLGVLTVSTERPGIDLYVRSLMADRGPGRIVFAGKTQHESFYIGGPIAEPFVRGIWLVSDASFTYPLLEADGPPSRAVDLLRSAVWDFDAIAKDNVWYFRDVVVSSLPIGGEVSLELEIERNRHIDFRGSLQRGTFYARGDLLAKKGSVTYLDTEFKVEEAGISLDTQYRQLPTLYGRAKTTVEDTLGVPSDIFLEIYSLDEVTDTKTEKARWENLRFELRSNDPNDASTRDILVKLGYSLDQSGERAVGVLSKAVDKRLVHPILRTFERKLQRATGLDVVGFTPTVVNNLLFSSVPPWASGVYHAAYLRLLQGTTFRLGKYVLNGDWFVSYSGELEGTMDAYQREMWGLKHRLGLEYMIQANTRLQLEYDYDKLLGEEDRRVSIRHRFAF